MTKNIKVGDTIVFKTETHVFDDSIFGTYIEPGTIVTIIIIRDITNYNDTHVVPLVKYEVIDANGKCMRVYSIDMNNNDSHNCSWFNMKIGMELGDVITFKDDVNAWVNEIRYVIKPGTLCTIVKIENDHEGMLIRLTLIMDNNYEARVYSISLCGIAPIKI